MNDVTIEFDENINNIKNTFFSVLDDYKKYYVYYNKNPEVEEFYNNYTLSVSQLIDANKSIIKQTENINASIESLGNEMADMSRELEKEKVKNTSMSKTLTNLQNTQDGSETLINDSKMMYNYQYLKNIQLFVGILIQGLILRLFMKKTQ